MHILESLKSRRLYFEGAAGTIFQEKGLRPGEFPEIWNLTHPDIVRNLHEQYIDAGCNILQTNTFGANPLKFPGNDGKPPLEAVLSAAISNALAAREHSKKDAYVVLDIGPLGKLLRPLGDLDFEDAIGHFAQIFKLTRDFPLDAILIETMNDSYETKAAVLAAKENTTLPVLVSNVYDENGCLMTGASPEAMVAMLEGLRADAIGMNCSLGPVQMKPLVPRLVDAASVPVFVCPNAGLPRSENGRTVYDINPDEFAMHMKDIAAMGVCAIGGCCGTTPEYMKKMIKEASNVPFKPPADKARSVISSYTHTVEFGKNPILIGERINPTGKKRFKQALREHDIDYVLEEGIRQQEAGVQVLDVNVGLPEIDEDDVMSSCVFGLQSVLNLPLQIDTTDATVMAHAMRIYNGKPMINSVNGKPDVMDKIFPLVAKYGGLVVALTLDGDGIPFLADDRVRIAEKIIARAADFGIDRKDIIIDPLAMAISADDKSAIETLRAVELITHKLGCLTSLGVSNISFGLPKRNLINGTFFTMALHSGLSAAIMNPFSRDMMNAYKCFMALSGRDGHCMEYMDYAKSLPDNAPLKETAPGSTIDSVSRTACAIEDPSFVPPLEKAIIAGFKDKSASIAKELLKTQDPLEIINKQIVPALDRVGRDFEKKQIFLPQLLISAEAAKCAFDIIKFAIRDKGVAKKSGGRIIVATVKGDIHDIGKNIVKVLLENYGFDVMDLGKDVAPEKIAAYAAQYDVRLVGLSALMTTTVPAMAETIKLLKEKTPLCKCVVGGAVLTPEYAAMIKADHYAKDAMETVRYAENILKGSNS